LKHTLTDQRQRVTWLLGAGCSASSGIPTAGAMVRSWLRELHAMQGTGAGSFDGWVKTEFGSYTDEQAGRFYAKAFQRRHPSALERQRAIEMFCAKAQPGYGYATFAQLLSHERFGRLCNTVLTTNFDDLVADALYLHGAFDARPQVIAHEAVTHFARISSPRPTVIKLHGDAHLDPKNIESETKLLPDTVCLHLYPFLSDSALIFLGYSGGDESIATFFCGQPAPALAPQIYWIGSQPPASNTLAEWFAKRGALHVDHRDFDSLMHLIRGALEIPHPKFEERMKEIAQQYHARRVDLEKEAGGVSNPEEKAALEKASTTTAGSLTGIWAILARARRQRNDDPDAAEKSYEEALTVDDKNSVAHHEYAYFLQTIRKDMDRAEAQYKRAIEFDPKYITALANYAHLLATVRKDMVEAEARYVRAIEADPKHAAARIGYAAFLGRRGDFVPLREQLNEVHASATEPRLAARLHFLRFAHLADARDDALRALSRVLPTAEPSPFFDLMPNVERAGTDGHPDMPLLKDLAKVLKGEASIEILEQHPTWLGAKRASVASNQQRRSMRNKKR